MSETLKDLYYWKNWSTVEDLAQVFNRTKRRIQQVIASSSTNIEKGILITGEDTEVKATPIYRWK